MGRSTFSGPIIAGSQRFGAQRDVGFTVLSQSIFLDFSVSTPGANNYGRSEEHTSELQSH